MIYTIENETLRVCVDSLGAHLTSFFHKGTATEHLWQGDPAVWSGQAPVLFPHTGRLPGGKFTAKGRTFESSPHGFAKLVEHTLEDKREDRLTLVLEETPQTLERFPYQFRLISEFFLEGSALHHRLTVENTGREVLRFGIGFHPAFRLPFDQNHSYRDYDLEFDQLESPLCLDTSQGGLVGDRIYRLGHNIRRIPLTDTLFDNDSHCMTGLHSGSLRLLERDTGRAVECDIRDFPYVLLWSKPGAPKFVCIEPWHSLPSPVSGGDSWEEKPAAAALSPGERWSTTLTTRIL